MEKCGSTCKSDADLQRRGGLSFNGTFASTRGWDRVTEIVMEETFMIVIFESNQVITPLNQFVLDALSVARAANSINIVMRADRQYFYEPHIWELFFDTARVVCNIFLVRLTYTSFRSLFPATPI